MARNIMLATTLFLAVFAMSMASAAVTFFPSTLSGTVQQGNSLNLDFKFYNNYGTDLTNITYTFEDLTYNSNTITTASQSLSGEVLSLQSYTNSSTITYSAAVPTSTPAGTYTGNLRINGRYNSPVGPYNLPISITVTEAPTSTTNWCAAEVGDLEISDINIDNLGEGDDDVWEPLDGISIEVDVKNTNRDDPVQDVLVEIKILDEDGKDVTSDFDFKDEQDDRGRISDKDTETAVFTIEELPTDIEDGTYYIYVKAYSEGEENLQCASEYSDDAYQEVDVERIDDEAVIVRIADLTESIQAVCGEKNVEVTIPIYNVGVDKEEYVLVNLYNKELGIDVYELVDNLRSGKKKEVTFTFDVPKNLGEDSYYLDIFTFFVYDEDEDEYDETSYDRSSNDIDKDFRKKLEIISCTPPTPSISAKLASTAKVGTELIVRVTVTNSGAEDESYTFSAEGYESWAELVSIEPRTVTIDSGRSEEILLTLMPTESGVNNFRLVSYVEDQEYSQPVSVNVAAEGTEGTGTKGTLGELFENKLLTYVLIGIAVLLILIIIVLIGRLSSRRARD